MLNVEGGRTPVKGKGFMHSNAATPMRQRFASNTGRLVEPKFHQGAGQLAVASGGPVECGTSLDMLEYAETLATTNSARGGAYPGAAKRGRLMSVTSGSKDFPGDEDGDYVERYASPNSPLLFAYLLRRRFLRSPCEERLEEMK